jgi:hypothetical protein
MEIGPTPPSSGGAGPERRFTARVLRPVFQFVDVEATSDGEAAAAAARKAAELPEDAWDTDDEVNSANAVREVIRVVDHSRAARDAAEDAGEGPGLLDVVFDALDEALYARRYLLLRADLDEVEGALVLPPWLVEFGDDLELADLAGDWLDAVGRLEQAAARGFWHDVDEAARRKGLPPPSDDAPLWRVCPRRPDNRAFCNRVGQ